MLLPTCDVFTDLYAARSFLGTGDVIWAGRTLALSLVPFAIFTMLASYSAIAGSCGQQSCLF